MIKQKFYDFFKEEPTPLAIKKVDFLDEGIYPIIGQGKGEVEGFTNDPNYLYSGKLPCIIFGEHSKETKLINTQFAISGSGVRILTTINPDYLIYGYYFLKQMKFPNLGYSRYYKHLKEQQVPFPNNKLLHYVSKLQKLEKLIKTREKSIELMDEYLKSIFLEMFGDPLSNIKMFKTVKLSNPCFSLSSGTTPSRSNFKYYENGTIPWVKSTDLNSDIVNKTEEFITEDAINETSLKMHPKGSILLAMYGQGKTRGKVSLLNIDAACNQACAVIQSNRFSNIFLFSFLNYSYDYLRNLSRGGNRQNLSLELLREIDIISPSVDDQLIYESIFNKVIKNKLNYNKSLSLLKELFNSLQYNLFNTKESEGDDIDSFIEDELKVDELLKSIVSYIDKTEQQYNMEKDLLFKILERTEKNNKDKKEYLKGIILKFEKGKITLKTNKEDKFSSNEIN